MSFELLRSRLLEGRPLVLDADTGASFRARGVLLNSPGALGQLLREKPSEVEAHYLAEIDSRVDVLSALTADTTPRALAEVGMEHRAAQLTGRAVELALEAVQASTRPVAVAGVLGSDMVSPVAADRLHEELTEHAARLAAAGSELLVARGQGSRLGLQAAVVAAARTELPTWAVIECGPTGDSTVEGDPHELVEALADAGALRDLAGNRHLTFWQVAGSERELPLAPVPGASEGTPLLAPPTEGQNIAAEYRSSGLTLGRHPLALLRETLAADHVLTSAALGDLPHGRVVRVAGIVTARQRPQSAGGVMFVTLEDETGYVNLVVWNDLAERQRRELLGSRLLAVRGQLQREGLVTHLVSRSFTDFTPALVQLAQGHDLGPAHLARADGPRQGPPHSRDESERRRREMLDRQARATLPSGRNFH